LHWTHILLGFGKQARPKLLGWQTQGSEIFFIMPRLIIFFIEKNI
jgi:hypothetical protein